MNNFLGNLDFKEPVYLAELIDLLRELAASNQSYHVYGGGTDLVPYFKNYPEMSRTLVSLAGIQELKGVRSTSTGKIEIGSQTKLIDIYREPVVGINFPGLSEVASQVASPQIRNLATLGGNLLVNNRCRFFNQSPLNRSYHETCYKSGGEVCHVIANAKRGDPVLCRARFVSDLAPVLLALDATLRIMGPSGERRLKIKDFYLPDGIQRNQLAGGEILVSVEIETLPRRKVVYEKLRIRKAIDFPSLGVAVGWVGDAPGRIWHVALTGVQTHPIHVSAAEVVSPTKTLQDLSDQAAKMAQPLKQDFLSPSYRRKMIPILIRRAHARLEG